MNTAGRIALGLGAWLLLTGCMLFPRRAPEPAPPIELEGCSQDHTNYWKPTDHGETWAEGEPADEACNDIGFFGGGGFQSADIFHFEPQLALTIPEGHEPFSVTFDVTDLSGAEITAQGFELYPDEIQPDGSMSFEPEIRFDEAWRGKNIHVVATVELLDENRDTYVVSTEAAFYLSHENLDDL